MILIQGPFSEEMNVALIHASDAKWLVTKDTGEAGGLPEKLAAHENALGLQMFAHRDGTDGFYVCRMRRVKA